MARKPVFLCEAKRSPIGSFQSELAGAPAPELGAQVIREIVRASAVPAESIEQVILGCVLTAAVGQAPARQAAIRAGLPVQTEALTVNKVCSSGLKAVMLAANAIELEEARCVLAGGMENMSQAPYLLPAMRHGARLGHTQAIDSIVSDGLWDVYNNFHMGNAAELCAKTFNITREEQDRFAAESYRRAQEAIEKGFFVSEIVPINVKEGKVEKVVAVDEEPGRVKLDKISTLKPVFDKEGTVTAANASTLNDGAAAMLVCSEDYVKKYQLTPLARLIVQGTHSQEPEWFTTAPIGATNQVLKKVGMKIGDIDLFEINEAFSAVALACQSKLEIDPTRLNINGGAVALGHPIGASGARILTTLLYSLRRLNLKTGLVSICNGGGEATAVIVERV